jgi:hypothetical protein
MIIVLTVNFSLTRFEQEVPCCNFKQHACKRPNVRSGVIFCTNQNLRRPILPGLNLGREVMVGPASVSQVANLEPHILINFRPPFVRSILLDELLHLPWIHYVETQVRDAKLITQRLVFN